MVKGLGAIKALWLLLLGLWLGMEAGVDFIAAPQLFINLKDNTVLAATLAGKFFRAQNIAGLVIVVLLVVTALALRHDRMFWKAPAILLLVCLMFLLIEVFWIAPQIQDLRGQLGALYGSTSAAPKEDAMKVRFDLMHQVSVIRVLIQLLLGASAFLVAAKRKSA